MPTGFPDALTPIAAFVEWLQPARVLDVGVGNGRMGFLAREYGHVPWHPRARGDGVVVHGIEGYEPYLGDVQRAVYDELVVGEALAQLERLADAGERYDLAIASDIIEHFTHAGGLRLVDLCLGVADVLVVATPREHFEQESAENDLETHRSHWSERELLRAGGRAVIHRGESTVCLFGEPTAIVDYVGSRRPSLRRRVVPPVVEDGARAVARLLGRD